jgi:hypothetical protein
LAARCEHTFYAWKWAVTRINDDLLDCVIYLYPSVEHAKKGERVGGTGFLLAVPTKLNPDKAFIYAITNSHVIREAKSPVIRLNTADGMTEVWPLAADHWLHHPDGDDLAITLLAGLDKSKHKWKSVDVGMLVTKGDLTKYDIGPGDDVVMVGRFMNHEGRQRNTPSARFGNISMMPWEPVLHGRGIYQESFLVETRSLGGYSGSPVFTFQPGPPRGTMVLKNAEKEAMPDFLLGVDWGHLPITERVLDKDGEPVAQEWFVKSNSGQMAVVPAWRLRDLLDMEALVRVRDLGELALKSLAEQGPVLDDVGWTPPRGPRPERLKIDDPLDMAVKRILKKGKPPADGV